MKEKCLKCKWYRTLNPHHIVNGKPFKSCTNGEVPETCRDFEPLIGEKLNERSRT